MKFFVLAAEEASQAQRNAITNYLNGNGFGFWHWIADFWIVQSSNNDLKAASLRDTIRELVPGLAFHVFGVRPIEGEWAGMGDPRSAEWSKKQWKDEG